MELDIDSFLRSRAGDLSSDSSDDGDPSATNRRTVDEILNDTDSSSSSSSSSLNSTIHNEEPNNFKTRTGELSSSSYLSSFSRPFPSLFNGVKPRIKPGAALAAAAAASRPIPTPHAAAIKSKRANSLSEASSRVGSSSLSGFDVAARELLQEEVVFSDTSENLKEDFPSPVSEPQSSVIQFEYEEVHVLEMNDDLLVVENVENVLPSNEEVVEVLATEDNCCNISDGNDSSIGEEESRTSSEVDGLDGQIVNEMDDTKNGEKKSCAPMKPLDWAEELEKRKASSGLHWEEGAAAQPMRLEGIRRGPPAVGYLQMDLDNMITRSVSSQTFKHDYGVPHVLAVHMSFIAVGTSKGVVLVFPCKYSSHYADNMDGKV